MKNLLGNRVYIYRHSYPFSILVIHKKLGFPPLMAAGKGYIGRSTSTYKAFDSEQIVFEFDEADVWSCANREVSPEHKRSIGLRVPARRSAQRTEKVDRFTGTTARSLPMNIPDWSKILREDSSANRRREDGDEDEERNGGREIRVPPHEYLARQLERTQIASFSVREGIGRTLKGRDLSRVRDAIWEKTGFED